MFQYLFICLLIFGIGDVLGTLTKAKLSSVFVSLILFLILFVTKIIPPDIIDQAGLTQLGKWATPFVVFHMGTMIDFEQLIREWKTVVLAILSMVVAMVTSFAVIPLIGRDAAIVCIPILNGGVVATQVMTKAAMEQGMTNAAILGTFLYAVQKFVGTPFASHYGLKEGQRVLEIYRRTGENIYRPKESQKQKKAATFYEKNSKYYGNFTCFAIVAGFSYLAQMLAGFTHINISIWALLLGVIVNALGFVPGRILEKSNASGLLNMAVFAGIIPSLSKISWADLPVIGFQTVVIFVALLIGIYVFVQLLPAWKIIQSKNVSMGVAVAQLLGFPATFLVANEVASAIAKTEDEKQVVLDVLMPKYVVAGLATVSSISIIIAGIFAGIL